VTATPVRVLIADDDDLMRAGLRAVLSSEKTIQVVGEAGDGRAAVNHTRALTPHVVLMDVRMPDMDGIAATRGILAGSPDVKIVILTTFEQDDYIFGALRAGASGFLLKRSRPEELMAAIKTVATGDALLSPSVTRRVIDRMARQPAPDTAPRQPLKELTPRERDVLELVARGLSKSRRRHHPRHRGIDGQDPRQEPPRQARSPRPPPSGDLRLRARPHPTRLANTRLRAASTERATEISLRKRPSHFSTRGRERHTGARSRAGRAPSALDRPPLTPARQGEASVCARSIGALGGRPRREPVGAISTRSLSLEGSARSARSKLVPLARPISGSRSGSGCRTCHRARPW
jgi:DNA-binding NarL/FixJ family response regulator